jgi:hypothetical protein
MEGQIVSADGIEFGSEGQGTKYSSGEQSWAGSFERSTFTSSPAKTRIGQGGCSGHHDDCRALSDKKFCNFGGSRSCVLSTLRSTRSHRQCNYEPVQHGGQNLTYK